MLIIFFTKKSEKVIVQDVDCAKLADFDLILSEGQSFQSKLINLFNFSSYNYSHIGIINKVDSKIFILHSTPDGTEENCIRYDELQTFFDLSDVCEYTIIRYDNLNNEMMSKIQTEIYTYKSKKIPFDYDFNNFDDSKVYCSELVWIIFRNAGLFKLSDFILERPILPKAFLKFHKFKSVECKKSALIK
jgi:uncharacterized protein YycO